MGVIAWVLGTVAVTTGCMIAVNQLAHGMFGQQTQVLGNSAIPSDPDLHAESETSGPGTSSPGPRHPNQKPVVRAGPNIGRTSGRTTGSDPPTGGQPSGGPTSGVTPSGTPSGGTLLESSGGSVLAECQGANAYLLAWSPAQGFGVDDVRRGPALTASVTFTNGPVTEVQIRVSCKGGVPVANVSSG